MKRISGFLLGLTIVLSVSSHVFAITVDLPGYSAYEFASFGVGGADIDIDKYGRVYAPFFQNVNDPTTYGIIRYLNDGTSELWSTEAGYSLAISQNGVSYVSKTSTIGSGIVRLNPDGSSVT